MNTQPQLTALHPGVKSFIGQPRQVLIDGGWVAAKSGKSFEVFDPANGGGYKQSGWGREMGHDALNNYLETKAVCASI